MLPPHRLPCSVGRLVRVGSGALFAGGFLAWAAIGWRQAATIADAGLVLALLAAGQLLLMGACLDVIFPRAARPVVWTLKIGCALWLVVGLVVALGMRAG